MIVIPNFPTPDPKMEGLEVVNPIRFITTLRERDKTNDLSQGFYEIRMDVMLQHDHQWMGKKTQVTAFWRQNESHVTAAEFSKGLRALADAIDGAEKE